MDKIYINLENLKGPVLAAIARELGIKYTYRANKTLLISQIREISLKNSLCYDKKPLKD